MLSLYLCGISVGAVVTSHRRHAGEKATEAATRHEENVVTLEDFLFVLG